MQKLYVIFWIFPQMSILSGFSGCRCHKMAILWFFPKCPFFLLQGCRCHKMAINKDESFWHLMWYIRVDLKKWQPRKANLHVCHCPISNYAIVLRATTTFTFTGTLHPPHRNSQTNFSIRSFERMSSVSGDLSVPGVFDIIIGHIFLVGNCIRY